MPEKPYTSEQLSFPNGRYKRFPSYPRGSIGANRLIPHAFKKFQGYQLEEFKFNYLMITFNLTFYLSNSHKVRP
jgi:hypothetical protein